MLLTQYYYKVPESFKVLLGLCWSVVLNDNSETLST